MTSTEISPAALKAFVRAEEQRLRERAPRLPFTRPEYAARRDRLRSLMAGAGIEVLLVTAPDAMCWLHGYDSRWYRSHSGTRFPPSQCSLVRVDSDAVLHIETAAHEELVRLTSCADEFLPIPASALDHEPTLDEFVTFVVGELAARGLPPGSVGVERWSSVPNPATLAALETALAGAGHRVQDATHIIRSARKLKSAAEIALIEQAQVAADAGVRHLHDQLQAGMTELDAWSLFMSGMVAAGGEPTAMHETIAVGPPMPFVHLASSRRVIEPGDYVHADVAGAVHRYHARATRMLTVGEPAPELVRMAEIAAGAHDVLTATARVGEPFGPLNRALHTYFQDAGVEGWAGGYELGLSFPPDWVGEFLWELLDHDSEELIEDGLVTNFETFAEGAAMVDTVVFEAGGARLLSSLPREILQVAG